MPFRRYSRRRFKRTRKLTRANILANRGAKAQSRQIAALNRKVNVLTKVNRPEVQSLWRTFQRTFTNSLLASNYEVGWYVSPYSSSGGKTFSALQGAYCRSMGFTFNCIVEYSDSWSGNVSQSENHQRSASYRFVILQQKQSQSSRLTDSSLFDRIFNVGSSTVSDDTNTTLPLKSGITSAYKVLFSKTYVISNQRPIRQHKITIPGSRLLNFNQEQNASSSMIDSVPKGEIMVAVLTGGLHADADYNSQIVMSATLKASFTDN